MKTQPEMTSRIRVEDFPGAELQPDGSVLLDMGDVIEHHLNIIYRTWDDVDYIHMDDEDAPAIFTVVFTAAADEDDLVITLTPPKSEFN